MPFFGLPRQMNYLCLSSLVVECAGLAPQHPLCFHCLSTDHPMRKRQREGSMFCFSFKLNISSPKGTGPHSEVVLYPQPSSKNQFNMSCSMSGISDIKLIRTDFFLEMFIQFSLSRLQVMSFRMYLTMAREVSVPLWNVALLRKYHIHKG